MWRDSRTVDTAADLAVPGRSRWRCDGIHYLARLVTSAGSFH
jgi:hypothetical protein